ncbi:iron sulfur cluster assembly 2 [Schistosoma japonicum]|nr:iron sulfur cluster assembly 2 [Schistosoma japonicum]
MLYMVLFSHLLLISGDIKECFSHTVFTVEHGLFTNIPVSGLVYIEVHKIPLGSKFIVFQVHSPFNSLLVSTSASFTYDTSQYSSHCGLVDFVDNKTFSTFYVYSSYTVPLTAWVKAVAYGSEFPLPGGCARDSHNGFMSAAIITDVMTRKINLSSTKRVEFLSYWTSALQIAAASVPVRSNGFVCPHRLTTNELLGSLVYHIYSAPLITAGGSYGAFVNPNPNETALVLENMANFNHPSFIGTYIQTFRQSEYTPDDEFIYNIIVSRHPATAYVVTVVVEYSVSGSMWQVPYVPVILFGCPTQTLPGFYRGAYIQPASNASLEVDCSIIPKDSPVILFPIAVLLIASFLYATLCNMWIWPRCAVSAMIMGSVIGLMFFYRFSDEFSGTCVILIVSALFPAFLSLLVFVILWWRYIRPTLHYRRVFGYGPLVKVENSTTVLVNEPWNSDVLDYNCQNIDAPVESSQTERAPSNNSNVLSPVNEEESSITALQLCNNLLHQDSARSFVSNEQESDDDTVTYSRICGIQFCRRSRIPQKSSKNPTRPLQPFSLRPRRFARLLPVLPAVFILISYLSVSLDRSLKLDTSSISFFSFSVIISGLLLGLLSIFKNFAFGISTAFVGFYITLCCSSFFLIPNCLLPHIVIEYFLMITCFDVRLRTLRIQFYGQYDVIVVVIWFVGSICFGLLALCLIRLQDARELSEAQNYRTLSSRLPFTDTNVRTLNHIGTPSNNLSLLGEIRSGSQASYYVPRMITVPSLPSNSSSVSSVHNLLLSPIVHTKVDSEVSINDSVAIDYYRSSNPSTSRVLTEKQPLLQGSFHNKYGGLMSSGTGFPSLLPLSRVQLSAASYPLPLNSSSCIYAPVKSIRVNVNEGEIEADSPTQCK